MNLPASTTLSFSLFLVSTLSRHLPLLVILNSGPNFLHLSTSNTHSLLYVFPLEPQNGGINSRVHFRKQGSSLKEFIILIFREMKVVKKIGRHCKIFYRKIIISRLSSEATLVTTLFFFLLSFRRRFF